MEQQRVSFYRTHTIMAEILYGKKYITIDGMFYGPFDLPSCEVEEELKKIEGIYALPNGYLKQQISRIKTL